MAEIDRLDIVIATSVKDAKAQITQLQAELKAMQKTLKNVKSGDAFSNASKSAKSAAKQINESTKAIANTGKKVSKAMSPQDSSKLFQESIKNLDRIKSKYADYARDISKVQKYMSKRGLKDDYAETMRVMNAQTKAIISQNKKAAKSLATLRDQMGATSFNIPDTRIGATKALQEYRKMYATARDKVMSAQSHGENYGKVYRNQVEQMYKAAEGIKAARKILNEKAAKDSAYEQLLEQERAAKEATQSIEDLASAYDDVANSSSKIKYVNQSRLDQFREAYNQGKARIGASPYLKTNQEEAQSYRSLRDTISSMADSIRSKAQEMGSAVSLTFENMKAKVSNFKLALREKAVASGILSYTQDFVTLQKSIEKTRADYARLTQAMNEYKAAGGSENDTTYKRYRARADRMSSELDGSMKAARQMQMDGSAYEVNTQNAQKNLEGLRSSFQRVTDTAKRATRAVGSFILRVTGIKGASNKAKSAMSNVTNLAKKLSKELLRVSKMLKLMVTRMALRAVISNVGDGFKSLAIHSAAFNESMSNLINSAKTLGYSIAGMVSPLINALAPALVYIINLITQAVNAINQLFSALTGAGTWNKAKNFTDSWADSIKGTTGAAKELKKTVLGFDELNQLQDNKNSGGGGSDIKDMFETVNIDPKWKEVAEWLKDMWKNKDFTELGSNLGKKLKDALDSIPWDKIRQTSNDLGKALATLINGFVEVEGLAGSIGKTVAQGVNTVFEFINGFVHNLHWASIGKFIAETFNGFFENIDWRLIEDTVITGLKGLADGINSFVRHFNWDNISNFISKSVNIIAKGIYTFVKEVDWQQLGKELGNQLNETIKKIDWQQVGKTIGAIIQSAINFVKSFIKQLNWADVKKAISDLISGFFSEVNKEDLAKIIAGVVAFAMARGVALSIPTIIAQNLGGSLLGALFGKTAVSGAAGAASSAGLTVGLAYTAALGGEITRFVSNSSLLKDVLLDVSGAISGNKEQTDKLKEAYSGADGTVRLFKDGILAGWYALTGQTDKIKELSDKTRVLTDAQGNAIGAVDRYGNSVIELTGSIEDATKASGASIEVYDNWKASIADATDAADIGADKMYDFKIAVDEAGKVSATVSEHIFPKLGENTYKAASAEESLTKAVEDYRKKIEETKNHQTVYKTTTDVIREAQEKNVKVVEASAKEYEVLKDDVGNVTIKLQDNKPAFEKAGDAAKDANKKVADYVGTTKDNIRLVADNTEKLKENKPAFEKAGEAAKDASKKLDGYKDSTEQATRKIPDMNKGVQDACTEMGNLSSTAEDTTRKVSSAFSKENWTFSGISEGLSASFEAAKSAIKSSWNSIADKLNGEHDIGESKIRINLPKFSAGGFPEDGLFMANSNELVGRFTNGKTAVANNDQIVSGIQSGVYNAVLSAMSQTSGGSSYISNEIVVDGEVIARSITKAQEKRDRRYSPQTV